MIHPSHHFIYSIIIFLTMGKKNSDMFSSKHDIYFLIDHIDKQGAPLLWMNNFGRKLFLFFAPYSGRSRQFTGHVSSCRDTSPATTWNVRSLGQGFSTHSRAGWKSQYKEGRNRIGSPILAPNSCLILFYLYLPNKVGIYLFDFSPIEWELTGEGMGFTITLRPQWKRTHR